MFGVVVCLQKGNATAAAAPTTAAAAGTSGTGTRALPGGFTILSEKSLALGQKVSSVLLIVFKTMLQLFAVRPPTYARSSS